MKITVEQTPGAANEIVLRCESLDGEMLELLSLLHARDRRLMGHGEGETHLLEPRRVLYCETVDDVTFAYTEGAVHRVSLSLSELERDFSPFGFFRCGKATVVNLNAIERLKSCVGGRVEATLANGERVMVSRHYAALLRERLGL